MFGARVAFGFTAGVLSILSPCVVPILPVIFGAASARHRFGPAILAAGVAVSFTMAGLFAATIGFSLGIDQDLLRDAAAVILIGIGLTMVIPKLQVAFASTASRLTSAIVPIASQPAGPGLHGQFILGLTLGVVWSPCTGPTLGAASLLAMQEHALPEVALTMSMFGVGAALPLIALGVISRRIGSRWRGRLLSAGETGKVALGAVTALIGIVILTGLEKPVEALLVTVSPEWLTHLTTRF